ncbi:hypothetical protein COCVIDRAFT_98669, partial [Bipolaris victoriae FI3]
LPHACRSSNSIPHTANPHTSRVSAEEPRCALLRDEKEEKKKRKKKLGSTNVGQCVTSRRATTGSGGMTKSLCNSHRTHFTSARLS